MNEVYAYTLFNRGTHSVFLRFQFKIILILNILLNNEINADKDNGRIRSKNNLYKFKSSNFTDVLSLRSLG